MFIYQRRGNRFESVGEGQGRESVGRGSSFDWTEQWWQVFKTDKQEQKQNKTKQKNYFERLLRSCLLNDLHDKTEIHLIRSGKAGGVPTL